MLYPLIYDKQPHLAGKLTGMLLCQNFGVLRYALDHEEYLDTLITEGLSVLAAGQKQVAAIAKTYCHLDNCALSTGADSSGTRGQTARSSSTR